MARAAPEDRCGRLALDPEELRRKYREKRDKRPRPDSEAHTSMSPAVSAGPAA